MQPGKEGLKPESSREGELSVAGESTHRQAAHSSGGGAGRRAVRGVHGEGDQNLKAIWTDGVREGPSMV